MSKRLIIASTVLFFLLFCLVFFYPLLLSGYAGLFTVQNATRGADALVVLGGGISTRFPRAMELYQQGYAPQILLTDLRVHNNRFKDILCTQENKARRILKIMKADAPLEVVPSLKKGATSTFDEAWDLLHYSRKTGLKHLIIVTDNCHTRRALYAFQKVFSGSGVQLEVAGARNDIFNERNWWRSDQGIAMYVLEGIKFGVYLFTSQNVEFVNNY